MSFKKDTMLYKDLPMELIPKPKREYETVFKNLIYILFIFILCGLVAFGLVVAYGVYLGECIANPPSPSSNLSISISAVKPTKLEYIWPDNVEKLVNNIVDNNMHVTNDDRGVLIKTELMRFKTNDVFYIIVYEDTQSPLHHAFYGNQSEYITVFKPGKCNVIVYRSRFWTGSPEYALTTVTKEIEDSCKKGIQEKSDYSDVPKELFENFHDIQFMGLIDKNLGVSIRSANSFGRVWGPGYWDTVQVLDKETGKATGKEFILIAGYK